MDYMTDTVEVEVHVTRFKDGGVYRTRIVAKLLRELLADGIVEMTDEYEDIGSSLVREGVIGSDGWAWYLPEENEETVDAMYMELIDSMFSESDKKSDGGDDGENIKPVSVDV